MPVGHCNVTPVNSDNPDILRRRSEDQDGQWAFQGLQDGLVTLSLYPSAGQMIASSEAGLYVLDGNTKYSPTLRVGSPPSLTLLAHFVNIQSGQGPINCNCEGPHVQPPAKDQVIVGRGYSAVKEAGGGFASVSAKQIGARQWQIREHLKGGSGGDTTLRFLLDTGSDQRCATVAMSGSMSASPDQNSGAYTSYDFEVPDGQPNQFVFKSSPNLIFTPGGSNLIVPLNFSSQAEPGLRGLVGSTVVHLHMQQFTAQTGTNPNYDSDLTVMIDVADKQGGSCP